MKIKSLMLIAALIAIPATCNASIMFKFTEQGGSVTMTSSGTLETANLVSSDFLGWSGTGLGVYNNGGGNFAFMGGTDVGQVDTAFRFNDGTDFSAWAGGVPWSNPITTWTPTSGVNGFATVALDGFGLWNPGILVLQSQMNGTLWSPDQSWTRNGTFASLNLNPGTFTVSDSITGESITYQIGDSNSPVPEPSSIVLFGGLLLLGTAAARRRLVS